MSELTLSISTNGGEPGTKTVQVPDATYGGLVVAVTVADPMLMLLGMNDAYVDQLMDDWWKNVESNESFSLTYERTDFRGNKYTDVYSFTV